jgi:hypothetical protein
MSTQSLLAELKAKIHAQHAEDWKAFERLERRLLASPAEIERQLEFGITSSKETKARSGPDTETLIGSVERLFQSHPDVAWSVVTLGKKLRKDGFVLEAKNPHSSLNTAVARLAKRGLIGIYRPGSGRRPHLYKTLPSGNAAALRGRVLAISNEPTLENGKVEDGAGEEETTPLSQ